MCIRDSQGGNRPLYRIFDCLFLNDRDLTRYTLRKRREALEASITDVERRFEIHKFDEAKDASEIEPKLREVIATKGEGLVLKSPRSMYRLNDRNDDWIKVKPEYMTEFGEALDCVVIGGYFGSGKRGGNHSSFLCGLRVNQDAIVHGGVDPQRCLSFFKVGGGFAASDYAEIRHRTDGKWKDWDPRNPPSDLIVLGGGDRQFERPDQYIKPEDSFVLEVKAASVHSTDQFAFGHTLRFPRFKKVRTDKTWEQALSMAEFVELSATVAQEQQEKKFKVDDARRKRTTRKRKRALVIQGHDDQEVTTPYAGPATKVFEGMTFFIVTEALKPLKKSKVEIEALVKANGGKIVASEMDLNTICVADRGNVKATSIARNAKRHVIRPRWLYDAVQQSEIDLGKPRLHLPLEPQRHVYSMTKDEPIGEGAVDPHGDSYCRDVSTEELKDLLEKMRTIEEDEEDARVLFDQLVKHGSETEHLPGFMFRDLKAWFEPDVLDDSRIFYFADGTIVTSLDDDTITHVVVHKDSSRVDEIMKTLSRRRRMPRLVTAEWVHECWREKTRLDEERESSPVGMMKAFTNGTLGFAP